MCMILKHDIHVIPDPDGPREDWSTRMKSNREGTNVVILAEVLACKEFMRGGRRTVVLAPVERETGGQQAEPGTYSRNW